MKARRNEMTIRASVRTVTTLGPSFPISSIVCGVSEPTRVELEFMGERGPIKIMAPATLPAWLLMTQEDGESARFEVTIRRLHKAPRKVKR